MNGIVYLSGVSIHFLQFSGFAPTNDPMPRVRISVVIPPTIGAAPHPATATTHAFNAKCQ